MKKFSQKAVDLIKSFEGFESNPYKDAVGVWTIGYGTTRINGFPVGPDTTAVTKQSAEELLKNDMYQFQGEINRSLNTEPLNQDQFDALVSLVYNIGGSNFRRSTLRKKASNNPNDPTIKKEFLRWVYAGGKKLKGLERRRAAEAALYFGEKKKS